MSLRIVTADERLSAAAAKTTMAIFGPTGSGKTTLLKTLPSETTLCIDLEAGMKSVQDWPGDSIPVRTFADALDIACLVGGVNPAADPNGFFSEGHYRHLIQAYADLVPMIERKRIIFVDSITDLTRQAMAWAKTRPEAFSEKTGKPDTRGAYGLLAREVIALLKHLQHAPGKTVIFVGILEKVVDEFNRTTWQPQMEGGNLQSPIGCLTGQAATENRSTILLNQIVNVNSATGPRMPRIENLPILGPVGVPSSCCTAPSARTRRWTASRRPKPTRPAATTGLWI